MLSPDTFAESYLTVAFVLDVICLPFNEAILIVRFIIVGLSENVFTQASECPFAGASLDVLRPGEYSEDHGPLRSYVIVGDLSGAG
jgi:hypothetical protein